MSKFKVLSVNISEEKGTVKKPVDKLYFGYQGAENDAHAGNWNRMVSLLGIESIRKFEQESKRKIKFGDFAENITTEGIELFKTSPLDRFKSGNLILEVTQIGKKCHGSNCNIFKEVGNCVMPVEGIFCRVIEPGTLHPDDSFTYLPKIYRIKVITLSDRAFDGTYDDRTGPRITELNRTFFESKNKVVEIENVIIPDDELMLTKELSDGVSSGMDVIYTTGGTGIGPRDITIDVVSSLLDKTIPGIMEHIRMKYGAEKPAALISRSIAGTIGNSLVFCIPGSVGSANDYMTEIFKNLEHLVYMINGLDAH